MPWGVRWFLVLAACQGFRAVVAANQKNPIPMDDMEASQSFTEDDYAAELAIDGDPDTWSMTSPDVDDSAGWWKLDMKRNYKISGVSLTSANDPYDAYNLQQFKVTVVDGSTGVESTCATYAGEPFEASLTKYLPCEGEAIGSHVIVRKMAGSYLRGTVTLAEVRIFGEEAETTTAKSATAETTTPVTTTPETTTPETTTTETTTSETTTPETTTTETTTPETTTTETTTPETTTTETTPNKTTPNATEEEKSTTTKKSTKKKKKKKKAMTASSTKVTTIPSPAVPTTKPTEKRATQIGAFAFHVAQFAIDGDPNTCSIACRPCDHTTSVGRGWWQFDFQRIVTISRVEVLTCQSQEHANYLRDVRIILRADDTIDSKWSLCNYQTKSTEDVPSSSWLKFTCRRHVTGRYLRVERRNTAVFRPDAVALAEVKVYDRSGRVIETNDVTSGNIVEDRTVDEKVREGKWFRIDLTKASTIQTGTFEGMEANLAIDGNTSTYSVACVACHSRVGIGWWRVVLGGQHRIVAFQITSSPKEYDSNYLQEFLVEVERRGSPVGICTEYVNRTYLPPSTKLSVACNAVIEGDAVKVARTEDSSFRKDAIAIAEISFYAVRD